MKAFLSSSLTSVFLFTLLTLTACGNSGHSGSTSNSTSTADDTSVDDAYLDARNDLVLRDDFEDEDWYLDWGLSAAPQNSSIINDGTAMVGDSFLRIRVDEGEHYGTSFGYKFADMEQEEPDEIYFRYALRLGPTWTTANGGGGKLPGFGGTYGIAGWGGRPSDGTNGWSARGLFWPPEEGSDTGDTRIGFYCYHADMPGTYGDNWYWSGGTIGDQGIIRRNQWYQIEVYVKNNTPAENDGILKAWVDGTLVFDKQDIRFRDMEDLRIEQVWFDLYYGGSWTPPADMYIDFDAVVISQSYIGTSL